MFDVDRWAQLTPAPTDRDLVEAANAIGRPVLKLSEGVWGVVTLTPVWTHQSLDGCQLDYHRFDRNKLVEKVSVLSLKSTASYDVGYHLTNTLANMPASLQEVPHADPTVRVPGSHSDLDWVPTSVRVDGRLLPCMTTSGASWNAFIVDSEISIVSTPARNVDLFHLVSVLPSPHPA